MAVGVLLNLGISGLLHQSTFYLVTIIVEVLQLAVSTTMLYFCITGTKKKEKLVLTVKAWR